MLENIYDVLRSPRAAFVRIAEQENLKKAALLQICIMMINLLVDKNGTGISIGEQVLYLILGIPFIIFFWCLSAGIIHGIARLLGGCGTWKKQLIVISYSMVPEILFVPFQIMVLWLDGATEIIALLTATSCIWCLIFSVYAVKVVQKLSTIRAVLVVFMPSIVAVGIGVLLFFAMLAAHI